MARLADLPPEVLNMITEHLSAYHIGNIWICGCNTMNWKLSKAGGVTSFDFSHDYFHLDLWPNLISQFEHLLSISIINYPKNALYSRFTPNLLSLPPKMKKLHLAFAEDIKHFLDALSSNPAKFAQLEHIHCEGDEYRTSYDLTHIAKLTCLTCFILNTRSISPSLDISHFVAILPRSLREIPSTPVSWSSSIHLPPNTRTVTLERREGRGQRVMIDRNRIAEEGHLLVSFPPGMTDLRIDYLTPKMASLLPPTLTSLTLNNGPLTVEIMGFLTNSVTRMCTVNGRLDCENSFKALPRYLGTLNVLQSQFTSEQEWNETYQTKFLCIAQIESSSWLPRTLVDLALGTLDIPDSDWFINLPPYLTTLQLGVVDLPKDALLKLPCQQTLTHLDLRFSFSPTDGLSSIMHTLPRAITSLNFEDGDRVSDLSDEHLLNLPPGLTVLGCPSSPLVLGTCAPHLPRFLSSLIMPITPQWFTAFRKRMASDFFEQQRSSDGAKKKC
jgi:hypothetical protein